MIKLALVQPNYQVGPTALNAYYLPYSVGIIWAYAKNNLKTECEVTDWIFRRDPIEETALRLSKNNIVAVSCYIWNRNYSYELVKRIKHYNPNVLIIMGGPEPPITNTKLFSEVIPDVDIVVKQEGEQTFTEIINNYPNLDKIKQVPGLLINDNGVILDTGDSVRLEESNMIYSPYLEGVFEQLMIDNPDVEWNCTLESNRGCPYQCTFCDWGGLTYSKVKKIDLQRVFDEIEWMGKHKIGAMHIADANFGIFVDRDNLIVDKILEVQEKYGYPYRTGTSWAKNQKSEVIAIAKKLMGGTFNNGLTISVQSMDDTTLETIKRSNLEINKISEIYAEANSIGLPVSTELIMPLPGETLRSWKHGIIELLNLGQHNGVEVYQTQSLENTELNLVQKNIHKIKTIEAFGYMNNSQIGQPEECPESIAVVTETRTMPRDDVIEGFVYFWLINTFHVGGFAQLYARYLNKKDGVTYTDFYDKLSTYLKDNAWYNEKKHIIESTYAKWLEDGLPTDIKVDEVGLNHLVMSYHTLMEIHHLENHELVHEIMYDFIINTFKIDSSVLSDLRNLSSLYIVVRSDAHNYPKEITLNTNIISYIFENELELKHSDYEGVATYNDDCLLPKSVYLENLYFARRRAFGKTTLKHIDRVNQLSKCVDFATV
jgi:radical SAM superfamily enzyme YgiQ (UPF0313 family)